MVSVTTFATLSISLLATLASCAPSSSKAPRDYPPANSCKSGDLVYVTLIGAADAYYTVQVPCSKQWFPIDNPLSISHVQTSSGPCTFVGVDGGSYTAAGLSYGDFGPPQTVIGAVCGGW